MKKIMIVLLFVMTACAPSGYQVTPAMMASMNAYAAQYDVWYPDAYQNVAKECVENPTVVYWSEQLQSYAVTCALQTAPSYGIVTIDNYETVLNAFSISATSQGEVTKTLAALGWER